MRTGSGNGGPVMRFARLIWVVLALLSAGVCWAAHPPSKKSTVLTVHPGDKPMEMAAVRNLLTGNAGRPAHGAEGARGADFGVGSEGGPLPGRTPS